MVDSDRPFLELRLPKEDEYQAWLEWKRKQDETQENDENNQRVIIIEI